MTQRHKVFVSYHHENDQEYRNKFEQMCSDVIASRSVEEGDIDPSNKTETIRQTIRDKYLRDSTVTVVLIGTQTWQRKHIDWEIGSSIRHTEFNPRSGLIGILLPTHSDYRTGEYTPGLIPPRLHDNAKCGYAIIYNWTESPNEIQNWIHEAYIRKDQKPLDNSRPHFGKNRAGDYWTD